MIKLMLAKMKIQIKTTIAKYNDVIKFFSTILN